MNPSRQALALSIVYSLLLLVWLSAQLEFIEWTPHNLQYLFRQLLFGLILLQSFAIALLLISPSAKEWQDDALAISHILLFPLPFFTLIWLTGSASWSLLSNSLVLVCSFAAVAFFIQCGARWIAIRLNRQQLNASLAQVLLCIMVWNYRDLWWGWVQR